MIIEPKDINVIAKKLNELEKETFSSKSKNCMVTISPRKNAESSRFSRSPGIFSENEEYNSRWITIVTDLLKVENLFSSESKPLESGNTLSILNYSHIKSNSNGTLFLQSHKYRRVLRLHQSITTSVEDTYRPELQRPAVYESIRSARESGPENRVQGSHGLEVHAL